MVPFDKAPRLLHLPRVMAPSHLQEVRPPGQPTGTLSLGRVPMGDLPAPAEISVNQGGLAVKSTTLRLRCLILGQAANSRYLNAFWFGVLRGLPRNVSWLLVDCLSGMRFLPRELAAPKSG